MRHVRSLIWPGLVIASSMLAGAVFAVVDAWRRTVGPSESAAATIASITSLYSAAALAAAVLVLVCVGLERLLSIWIARWRRGLAGAFGVLWYSALTTAGTWETAVHTFSGNRVAATHYAIWGPYAMVAALCSGVLLVIWLGAWAHRLIACGSRVKPLLVAVLFLCGAATTMLVDLRLFVGLYPSLHALLEAIAAILLVGAMLVLHRLLAAGLPRTVVITSWVSTLLATTCTTVGLVQAHSRAEIDETLQYAWQEEVYLGRMLRRMAMLEAYFSRDGDWQGVELARIDTLRARYDITAAGRNPRWDEPWYEVPFVTEAIEKVRGVRRPWNVIVYYVDTLRADTARDPEAMPNVVGFAADNLSFENAYTSGSDTLRALPGITGGSYDFSLVAPTDILEVARTAGMKRMLTIGDSASTFLKAHRPEFAFDETITVADHVPGKQVWGYGADRFTSDTLVEESLQWIEKNRNTPFLSWILNYDQHAWQELPVPYLEAEAARLGLPTKDRPGIQHWRYRVVARLVDEQFGRLLAELERLGVADETIVLFLSDHGESLGRDGFWAHSVFLWEELVRVPLIVRVPGLGPETVRERVSLIDVTPTLARFLLDEPVLDGYHGEDLLANLVPERPRRHQPIVMAATAGLTLSRVGVIDQSGRWKLVVPFGSPKPELYDLDSSTPEENVARRQPTVAARLLGELVGTPIFPRNLSDFKAFIYH